MTQKEQVLIVFGATGDLMKKKIAPALLKLCTETPDAYPTAILAVGRSPYTTESFRSYLSSSLCELFGVCEALPDMFLARIEYVQGSADDRSLYTALRQKIPETSEVLTYCSLGCDKYNSIATHLDDEGLIRHTAWSGIVLEKPHGYSLGTYKTLVAPVLDRYVASNVFLIEHYFAKDLCSYILDFRFKERQFESVWNAQCIESIDIHLWEDFGVETRGAFYDTVGAYRDMGQNHVTQLLALVCMEAPAMDDAGISSARALFVGSLPLLSHSELTTQVKRFQYSGYTAIKDVAQDSTKETAFMLVFSITSGIMSGIRVFWGSGKRVGTQQSKEIVVHFKQGVKDPRDEHRFLRSITFSLQTFEGIIIVTDGPQGMHDERLEPTKREERIQYVGEYTKILRGALSHNQHYFVSAAEVQAMWRFADQFLDAFEHNKVPLIPYEKNDNTVLSAYETLKKQDVN